MEKNEQLKVGSRDLRNPSRAKRFLRTIRKAASLIFLCWMVSLAWECFQIAYGGDDYLRRRYGTELPWVTSVEIVSIGAWVSPVLEPHFRETERIRPHPTEEDEHYVFRKKTVRGEDAKRIAALWRAQTPLRGSAGCHEPAYILRFYTGPIKRAEVGICWHCYNFSVPALWSRTLLDFDAGSTNALALLEMLQRHAPLSTDNDFNYTNAPISAAEVEQRVARAMASGWNHESRKQLAEFAIHSPQRNQFEAALATRLLSEKNRELLGAIRALKEMRSPRQARAFARLLTHSDAEVRDLAGRALLGSGGEMQSELLLDAVGHADRLTRFHAFAALAAHAPLDRVTLDALSNRVERALSLFGTDAFPESYNGIRVRLSAERRKSVWPLIGRIADVCGTNFIGNFPQKKEEPIN